MARLVSSWFQAQDEPEPAGYMSVRYPKQLTKILRKLVVTLRGSRQRTTGRAGGPEGL
jgi:hypothetical protein